MTTGTRTRFAWPVMAVAVTAVCGVVALTSLAVWLAFGAHPGSRLNINVYPAGADIVIDGRSVGQTPLTLELEPGSYQVRIQREHYLAWETQVQLGEADVSLDRALVYQPFISTLTQNARFPHWTPEGGLLYVASGFPPRVIQWNGASAQALTELPFTPQSVVWSADGARVAALTATFGHLAVIVLDDNTTIPVAESAFGPAWQPDEETLTFANWSAGDGAETTLWSVSPGSAQVPLVATDLQAMFGAAAAAWAPDGGWLFTIDLNGLRLWRASETGLSAETLLSSVSYAAWAPDPANTRLAYVSGDDNTLWLTSPQSLNPTQLALNVTPPFRWSSDGTTIYYFSYRPAEGGSALWALNPELGTRTLLTDASISFGQVIDFAVSADGKRIAYVTDEHRLVLLTLGE